MSLNRVKPQFHGLHPVLSLEQQKEQELWFYFEHIQNAKTIREIARERHLAEIDLIKWANDSDVPVFDFKEIEDHQDRHAHLPKSTWDRTGRITLYLGIATAMAERSTCLSSQVGAVITVENRIVTQGYNGAPSGKFHCTDVGVCRKELLGFTHFDASIPGQVGGGYEASRAVHAEQGAICQAAKRGISIDGGDCYVTRKPCVGCHRMLANCGIENVWYYDINGSVVHMHPWGDML